MRWWNARDGSVVLHDGSDETLERDFESLSRRFGLKSVIGEGGFGQVFSISDPGKALKIVHKPAGRELLLLARECTLLLQRLPGCLWADVILELPSLVAIRMPLCEPVTDRDVKAVLRDIPLALNTLHGLGFIHCDVKPDNFFKRGRKCLLGDLGCLVTRAEALIGRTSCFDHVYRAPELEEGASYGPHVDFWSLALSVYDLKHGDLLDMFRETDYELEELDIERTTWNVTCHLAQQLIDDLPVMARKWLEPMLLCWARA